MARIEIDPNYTSPTFPRATEGTDLFKKEDVQQLAAAVSTHVHDGVHGLPLTASSIPNGTITSAMIADGTIVAGDIADGAVTSAKILDGTVATTDLADGAVTNTKLASDTARANLLTNGGFEISQRGSGPFTTNSTYSFDRWLQLQPAGGSISVSISSNVDVGSGSAAGISVTFGTGEGFFLQKIENHLGLRGLPISLSMRVRTSNANAVRLFMDGAAARTYSAYHSGDGTYQTLKLTITVLANATSIQVGLAFATSCSLDVDNAMLVVGSVPADYTPLHPADDLARCQRYYEIIGETAYTMIIGGYGSVSASWYQTIPYRSRKPVAPTVTKVGTWALTNVTGQPVIDVSGVDACRGAVVITAAGNGVANNAGAGQYITVEANP